MSTRKCSPQATSDQEVSSGSIKAAIWPKPEDVNFVTTKQDSKPPESPLSLVRLMGRYRIPMQDLDHSNVVELVSFEAIVIVQEITTQANVGSCTQTGG